MKASSVFRLSSFIALITAVLVVYVSYMYVIPFFTPVYLGVPAITSCDDTRIEVGRKRKYSMNFAFNSYVNYEYVKIRVGDKVIVDQEWDNVFKTPIKLKRGLVLQKDGIIYIDQLNDPTILRLDNPDVSINDERIFTGVDLMAERPVKELDSSIEFDYKSGSKSAVLFNNAMFTPEEFDVVASCIKNNRGALGVMYKETFTSCDEDCDRIDYFIYTNIPPITNPN